MAFKVFGDQRDLVDIPVVNDLDELVTSIARQDQLYAKGFHFEASSAQASLIEGLLLHYLFVAKQIDRVTFDEQTVKLLETERITFGQVKLALQRAGVFHDVSIGHKIEQYVTNRNLLTHHVASSLKKFELKYFYSNGRDIAFILWNRILEKTRTHRRANP